MFANRIIMYVIKCIIKNSSWQKTKTRVPSNLPHCAGVQGLKAIVQSSKHESSSPTSHSVIWSHAVCYAVLSFSLHITLQLSHIPSCLFFLLSFSRPASCTVSLNWLNRTAKAYSKGKVSYNSWEKCYPKSCPTCEFRKKYL